MCIRDRKEKGAIAYRKLKVYSGCPPEYKNLKKIVKGKSDLQCKYMTVKEVCRLIGAKNG